jgi:protein CpxP
MNQKFIAIVFFTACFPLAVLAEQVPPKNSNGSTDNQGINRMAKDLGLSDEQKARVETIINTEKQTVETIFKEEGEKLKVAQQQTHDNLQQVLTPEQMIKLEKKIQKNSNRHGNKKH